MTALDGMRPPPYLDLKTPFEVMSGKLRKRAYWVVLGLLILIGAIGLWNYIRPVPEELRLVGLGFGLLAMTLPVLAFGLETFASILSMFSMSRIQFRNFLAQIETDERYATLLNEYSEIELKGAKTALELKITRTRNKIGLIAGSPDKLALIALAGTGWAVFTSLSGTFPKALANGVRMTNLVDLLVVVVVSFLIGLAAGLVSAQVHMQRYVYQLELVNLALAKR